MPILRSYRAFRISVLDPKNAGTSGNPNGPSFRQFHALKTYIQRNIIKKLNCYI